jgi:hypothetical protein
MLALSSEVYGRGVITVMLMNEAMKLTDVGEKLNKPVHCLL